MQCETNLAFSSSLFIFLVCSTIAFCAIEKHYSQIFDVQLRKRVSNTFMKVGLFCTIRQFGRFARVSYPFLLTATQLNAAVYWRWQVEQQSCASLSFICSNNFLLEANAVNVPSIWLHLKQPFVTKGNSSIKFVALVARCTLYRLLVNLYYDSLDRIHHTGFSTCPYWAAFCLSKSTYDISNVLITSRFSR